jgi:hypothetical protein
MLAMLIFEPGTTNAVKNAMKNLNQGFLLWLSACNRKVA